MWLVRSYFYVACDLHNYREVRSLLGPGLERGYREIRLLLGPGMDRQI